MDASITQLLDEVLAQVDQGVVVSKQWLSSHYPTHTEELAANLRLVGLMAPDDGPPTAIGPFRILHELGRGGMGVVYLAEAVESMDGVKTGERIALKVIHSHLLDDERVRQRFLMEGLAGSRIRHPNVVRMISACRIPTNGHFAHCLLMELVDGPTLLSLRRPDVLTPEPLCRHAAQDIAAALVAIHEKGIVHCDVKPQNIVFARRAHFCLADLGIAYIAEDRTASRALSPLYAAPEQLDLSQDVDGRADLFALGRTLFHLATGEPPRRDQAAQLPDSYSPFFRELVRALTQPDREDRIQSAALLHDVLVQGEASEWWTTHEAYEPARSEYLSSAGYVHGRDAECDQLTQLVGRAAEGSGQVVLLEGPAGIGKTRLVQWLAQEHNHRVLVGGFQPETGTSSDSAIRSALRRSTDVTVAISRLPSSDCQLLQDWLRGDDAQTVDRHALEGAVTSLLQEYTKDVCSVFVLEDVHLAERAEVQLLQTIASRAEHMRLLVVMTARPTLDASQRDALAGLPTVSIVELGPLRDESVGSLVHDAFHPRRPAPSVLRWIVDRAGGHPLHALTLVHEIGAHEHFALRPDETWTLADAHLSNIGHDLDALISARLNALDAVDRRLLEQCACCGSTFSREVLRAVAGADAADQIPRLQASGWLISKGDECHFVHHRHHELVYESTDLAVRSSVHRTLATVLPELGFDDAVSRCRNALRGGLGVLAREHLLPAMARLRRRGRHGAAIRLASEALDTPGLLKGHARLDVLEGIESLFSDVEASTNDLVFLREYRDLADALGEVAHGCCARIRLSWCALRRQRYDEALSHLRSASMQLEGRGLEEWEQRVRIAWCQVENFQRNRDSQSHLAQQSAEYAQRTGDPVALMKSSEQLGHAAIMRGDLVAAAQHYADAGARAQDVPSHEMSVMIARGHQALAAFRCADFPAAQRFMSECEKIAQEFPNVRTRGIVRGTWGFLKAAQGHWAEALDDLRAGVSDVLDADDPREAATQLVGIGSIYAAMGDARRARSYLDEAAQLAEEMGDVERRAAIDGRLAWLTVQTETDEAIAAFERAYKHYGAFSEFPDYPIEWAETLAVQGRANDAAQYLTLAWTLLPNMGELNWMRAWADCWLGWVRNDARGYGVSMLRDHADRIPLPQRVGMHFAMWAQTDDQTHLDCARADLATLVERAPQSHRISMCEDVPLFRLVSSGQRPSR